MTKTYMINAYCLRPFIATIDINAHTPEEAIAIVRQQLGTLLDTAEECNGDYPWDEFAAYDDNGKALLHVLDPEARLREAASVMRDTLLYVAGELGAFKPDYLRQIGLNVALEQVEKALDLIDNPAAKSSTAAAPELLDALFLANAYIRYVKEHDPQLHQEANGTPAIDATIDAAICKTQGRAA